MKKAFFPLAIVIVLLFAFVAVSCNSDLYKPQNDTWAIGDMYFEKFSEAVSWLSSQDTSRAVSPSRTIKLLQDVNNAESIIIPQSFSGDVRIDFQWHSYVFSSDNQFFFKVEGGSRVEIVNERAVIPSGSSSSEKAIVVNGANVFTDDLSVDDRRARPQAVSVGSSGSLTIGSSSGNADRKMLGGAFEVNSGSQLVINGGLLEIDSLNQLSADVLFAINGGTVHYPHEIASSIESASSEGAQIFAIHDISGWIDSDPGVHYRECTECHVRFEEAPHQFSQWTYDSLLGVSTRVCFVCGRVEELDHRHEIVSVPYKAKTCTEDGHASYWHCPVCSLMFSDAEGHSPITMEDVRIPASHNLVHVPFSAHNCTEDGVVEHWFCLDCGKAFTDQTATVERTSIVIPASHQMVYHEPVVATCTTSGMLGYWSCSVCGGVFADQLGKQGTTLQTLVVPATGHSPIRREAHDATCGSEGNTEYWICSTCGLLFSDESCSHEIALSDTFVPALVHNPIHTEAFEPTCTSDGNIEYWTCSLCSKVFSDAQCTHEISQASLAVSKLGHLLSHIGAVSATCTSEGNAEYWKCSRCGLLFADQACTYEIALSDTVIARTAHSLKHTSAVEPTCLSAGNSEYWTCSECGKHFADSFGSAELASENLVIARLDHSLEHVVSVAPTCTAGGNIEYWRCAECGRYFSDAQAANQIQASATVLAKKGHSPVHHGYIAPTCTADGQMEHWTCPDCGKSFLDAACTIEAEPSRLVIEKLGHDIRHVAELDATCTQEGHIEYWQCSRCNLIWSDSGLTEAISSSQTVIHSPGHNLRHVESIEASCTSTGNIEYWTCNTCGRYFSDAGAQHEITAASTVVPIKSHIADIHTAAKSASCTEDGNIEYWACSECGTLFSDSQCHNAVSASDVILDAIGHSPEHHDAVAPTCTSSGNIEYWKCLRCGKLFSDSTLTSEITLAQAVVAPLPHSLVHYHYVPATCTEDGSAEHWHCSVCGNDYADSDASVRVDDIDIPAYGHDLERIDALAATCTDAGHTAYSHCLRCDLYFNSLGTAQIDLASTVIPATGHTLSDWVSTDAEHHWKECSVCHEHLSEEEHSFGEWAYDSVRDRQVNECSVCHRVVEKAHTHVLESHAAIPHTCTSDGNVAYYECTECHRRFSDSSTAVLLVSVVDPASHTLSFVPAVSATCTSSGVVEHWHCSVCGKDYADENGSSVLGNVVVAALGHNLEYIDAVSATCTDAGHTAYSHCLRCDLYFNAEGTSQIELASTVVPALGHTLTGWVSTDAGHHWKECSVCHEHLLEEEHSFGEWQYDSQSDLQERFCSVCGHRATKVHSHVLEYHEAVSHTCTTDGNVAYYECTECHRYFRDYAQTVELASVVDPASHTLSHVPAVAATCTSAGVVEHWHCSVCGKDFSDNVGQTELQSTVEAKLSHRMTHHAAVAATCTSVGNVEYWSCSECGINYADASGNSVLADVSVPVIAHSLMHHEAVAASCTADGNMEYWECSLCHALFADDSASIVLQGSVVLSATGHSLVRHDAVEPTCTSSGTVEYWHCSICGNNYSDSAASQEAQSLVVPMIAHSAVHHEAVAATCVASGSAEYWQCSVCSAVFSDSGCTHQTDIASTVIPKKDHSVTMVEAKPATCTLSGNTRYWVCGECGKLFSSADCTVEVDALDVVVPAAGHSLIHVAGMEATCTSAGEAEHWHCSVCNKDFSDSRGTAELASTFIPMVAHTVVHHDAVAATCTAEGSVEYWSCSVCHGIFADSQCSIELTSQMLSVPALSHDLIHSQRVEPTCTQPGHIEYWSCSRCSLLFSDVSGLHVVSLRDTVLAAKGHSATGTPALPPTCTSAGNSAYWYCAECGHYFSDSACTHQIAENSWVIQSPGHSLNHVEYVAPTCTQTGTAEHWHCSVCGKNYADSSAMSELANVVITATGHSPVATAAKAATCTEAGNSIYWTCTICGKYFSDERCQNEIAQGSWTVSALGHSLSHAPAVAATCTSSGLVEHWHCSVCGHDFSDSQASADITGSVAVAPLGHSTVSTSAVAPTCTSAGNSAYWTCTACGRHFSDAACSHEIEQGSWILSALGHSLEHVEAVEPTCVENGNIEHWRCTRCAETFEDSEGLVEITGSVVLPATGHSFPGYEFDENRHWLECSVCHAQINAATHQWGEEKDCLDGHHRVRECSVCGAIKNETVAGYQIINTSIGTISVPVAESAPCGTVRIVRTGNTVRVKYSPNINSNPNYSVTCRYLKGTWSDYLVPDADGYYVFNVDGKSNYKIVIQAYNGGGTSVYETTIR